MQLPDRSYELKHTSYGKMINVRASEIQPNISLPNTVDSAATIGETKRVTADQKDLANRDRVSYITLLGHRIQDGFIHPSPIPIMQYFFRKSSV
jgi:hypothetical protein